MYKKVVVPMDGSKLAECVLTHVEDIAKGCGTEEVTLVTVAERIVGYSGLKYVTQPIEPLPQHEPVFEVPVSVGKKQRQILSYLDRIAKGLREKKVNVRTEVLIGHPAEEIVLFAENNEADLIIIASHGRSGISRWALGSIAERVFRGSKVPVLMVGAPGRVTGA